MGLHGGRYSWQRQLFIQVLIFPDLHRWVLESFWPTWWSCWIVYDFSDVWCLHFLDLISHRIGGLINSAIKSNFLWSGYRIRSSIKFVSWFHGSGVIIIDLRFNVDQVEIIPQLTWISCVGIPLLKDLKLIGTTRQILIIRALPHVSMIIFTRCLSIDMTILVFV